MIHRTLTFPTWINPDGTKHERIITFYNDGQFTTNSETDHKVPQNEAKKYSTDVSTHTSSAVKL